MLAPTDLLDERPWYQSTFSSTERVYLSEIYQPLGFANRQQGPDDLLVGDALGVAAGLSQLAGWFDNPRDRNRYAVPMLSLLVTLLGDMDLSAVKDVEKLHFIYQSVMEHGYKLRNDDAQWLEIVVWAAKAQVDMARQVAVAMERDYPAGVLPSHAGYERLAILADKAGDDHEVIRLSELAQSQGWDGQWVRRIEKARKRLAAAG